MGGGGAVVKYNLHFLPPLPPIKKNLTQTSPVLLGFPRELENFIQATIPKKSINYIFPPSPKNHTGWAIYIISPPIPPHP